MATATHQSGMSPTSRPSQRRSTAPRRPGPAGGGEAVSTFTSPCVLYRVGRAPASGTASPTAGGDGDDGGREGRPLNVKVSWDQKLSIYVRRAKSWLVSKERVAISGIGMAVSSVVMCAEILRDGGFADIYRVDTSMLKSQAPGAPLHQKPVLEIVVERTDQFHELMQREQAAREERQRRAPRRADADRRRDDEEEEEVGGEEEEEVGGEEEEQEQGAQA
ncbi:hypothetical protein CDCA_CDCA07G2256 [Cyanidium caldarium]|uniref:DNA/RNA-binding protein Alba-like domain-containing protein n=1 Tax=Cyanidium caldarium TaxID=2771 RepID=A0AAV9IVZ8_CYACA|nr:hypothetical protein CDCA_CDCA07G2256 [Cyanidium caldarium]